MNYYASFLIPSIIVIILSIGIFKKIDIFETFIDGVREGLEMTVKIVPYILAFFLSIDLMNKSGLFEIIISAVKPFFDYIKFPVEVLPLILLKPFSGSGYLVVLNDILKQYGPESFVGKFACILAGSTETIFYVLTVYFGYIGIKKLRHAILAAVTTEVAAIFIGWAVALLFYHVS